MADHEEERDRGRKDIREDPEPASKRRRKSSLSDASNGEDKEREEEEEEVVGPLPTLVSSATENEKKTKSKILYIYDQ